MDGDWGHDAIFGIILTVAIAGQSTATHLSTCQSSPYGQHEHVVQLMSGSWPYTWFELHSSSLWNKEEQGVIDVNVCNGM